MWVDQASFFENWVSQKWNFNRRLFVSYCRYTYNSVRHINHVYNRLFPYFVGDTNTLFSITGFFLSDSFSLMTQLQEQALISLAKCKLCWNDFTKWLPQKTDMRAQSDRTTKYLKKSTECKTHWHIYDLAHHNNNNYWHYHHNDYLLLLLLEL